MSEKGEKTVAEMTHCEKIAFVNGCSPRQVQYVLGGERSQGTKLAERIILADSLIKDGENLLITEVKRVVNL